MTLSDFDLTDPETLLIAADWCEENGEEALATAMREGPVDLPGESIERKGMYYYASHTDYPDGRERTDPQGRYLSQSLFAALDGELVDRQYWKGKYFPSIQEGVLALLRAKASLLCAR